MKKGLIVLMSILMTSFVCSCNFGVKLEADNQPSSETPGAGSPGTGTPQDGGAGAGGESQPLCTITGKALYANSNDSSSIKVCIDKNEGVFTQPVLNMAFPNDLRYAPKSSERSIVSYSNCAKDGSYSFSNLEPGTYSVYATSSDSTEKAVCQNIRVTSGQTLKIPDLKLTATGSLSGKIILDNSQNNNAGFVVFAAGTSFMAVTGSSGNFTISGVPANTSYEIIIMKGSFTYLWQTNVQAIPLTDTQIGEKSFSSIELLDNYGLKYPIKYELNGGDLPDGSPTMHMYGTVTRLLEPVREGYIFYGYHLREDCLDEPFTEIGNNYGVGQTLYVKWIACPQALELIDFTESGTFVLPETVSESYLEDLHYALKYIYLRNPEIKISLDFSRVTGITIRNEQHLNDCPNITGIVISPALFNTWNNSISNYSKLFSDNDSLKTVALYEGMQSVPDGAFSGCSKLTSLIIPESVTSIGNNAFYGCTGLTTITIPENVTSIGSSAFYFCTGLTNITVPESVTSIGDSAFSNCSDIESIIIPDSIHTIGNSWFNGCSNLSTITLPQTITSIGEFAFTGCSKLKSFSIPASVTTMGINAFWGCTGLESVIIGNGLETISARAFEGCTSLTDISIGSGVKKISYSAFNGCSSLESLAIPDSVNCIEWGVFYNCENLTSISMTGRWGFYTFETLNNGSIQLHTTPVDGFNASNTDPDDIADLYKQNWYYILVRN